MILGGAENDAGKNLTTKTDAYGPTSIISEVRSQVDAWRNFAPPQWQVTPETERLPQRWRHPKLGGVRPFFARSRPSKPPSGLPKSHPPTVSGKKLLQSLKAVNAEANPTIERLALMLASGTGKTTVMTMLLAWQTLNAVRGAGSNPFMRDPDNYYRTRELVPQDPLEDMKKARIVTTNYHAFKRRERFELSVGGGALLQGRTGPDLQTLETEGQMLQRAMPELMGIKHVLAFNDEAQHCYREKPPDPEDEVRKGDDRNEAEKNHQGARVWISGLEAVNRGLDLTRVIDLSPAPFFLRGSGYAEGTLFIDTDYTEERFFVRHAYVLGQNDAHGALKTTRQAEIDARPVGDAEQRNVPSIPMPKSGRIAVKVVSHLGDEVMKVFRVD